ncbi:hypothetical protein [Haliangium sp.]|uniref:hypothetical protein n=1 Tax=Haliangium sp. TaxID=2663208 RepID=UPI003D0F021D
MGCAVGADPGVDAVGAELALTGGDGSALSAAVDTTAVAVSAASIASGELVRAGGRGHHEPVTDLFEVAGGHWRGPCSLIYPGHPESVLDFEMEREVFPTEEPGRYTWRIIYRSDTFEQVRDYVMIEVDPARGYYVLDEDNGILIDHFLYPSGVLMSEFEVLGKRLTTREAFHGRRLHLEFVTTSMEPLTRSDLGDGFIIDSYPFFANQACDLERVPSLPTP